MRCNGDSFVAEGEDAWLDAGRLAIAPAFAFDFLSDGSDARVRGSLGLKEW
jgi:hypothetical protein